MNDMCVKQASGKCWTLYNGDCVDVLSALPDDSIGYTIFSPPFSQLYVYSNSERDLGNCKSDKEFMTHFRFVAENLMRLTMPGRLVSIHCMLIPAMKERDGYIGLKDFRGDIIRLFQDVGFIFHGEVTIWKDPLVEATRTKALGLMHKQLCKDSSMCRQGLPDYVVTMRKPGENTDLIDHPEGLTAYAGSDEVKKGTYSHEVWRKYASPIWFDIRQTRTLNKSGAREEKDERHICPLQLDVIERCLTLWSKPDDVVLSPFAGIGSEGYQAVKMDRRFVGVELKESYFECAVKNLVMVESETVQLDLFSQVGCLVSSPATEAAETPTIRAKENNPAGAFLQDIVSVYEKHGMSLGHEDAHGGFLVNPYKNSNIEWLMEAVLKLDGES